MAKTGIVFYKSSLNKCYRQIEKARVKYEKKVNTLLERLGELGKTTAWDTYHEAQDEERKGMGHTISVTYEMVDTNVIEIRANGKGVCFVEFGAGATADSGHPFADNVPFEVRKGSWSDAHNGPYQASGYDGWWFGGVYMDRVERHSGMYEAYKEITQRVYEIAKEVFG